MHLENITRAAQDAALTRRDRIEAAEAKVVAEAVAWSDDRRHPIRGAELALACAVDKLLAARKAAEKGTAG